MKQAMELSNTNKKIVIGSLNPQKVIQDRGSCVLSINGLCQTIRATDYKDPPMVLVYDKQTIKY